MDLQSAISVQIGLRLYFFIALNRDPDLNLQNNRQELHRLQFINRNSITLLSTINLVLPKQCEMNIQRPINFTLEIKPSHGHQDGKPMLALQYSLFLLHSPFPD